MGDCVFFGRGKGVLVKDRKMNACTRVFLGLKYLSRR